MTTAGPRTFYRGLKTAEKISFLSPFVRPPQQDMTKAQKDIFPTFLHHHSRSRTFYRGLKTEAEKTSFTSPFVRQTTADLDHSTGVSKRKLKGYLTKFLLLGGRHDRRTEHLSGHTSFRWRCTRHPHLHFPTIHPQCKPNTQKPIHGWSWKGKKTRNEWKRSRCGRRKCNRRYCSLVLWSVPSPHLHSTAFSLSYFHFHISFFS